MTSGRYPHNVFGQLCHILLLLCAEGNRVLVTDLKSTNGTFIEEEEIEAMTPNDLPLGSEVIFGEASSMTAQYSSARMLNAVKHQG